MIVQRILAAAFLGVLPATALAAGSSLRGSPHSMERQHGVALNEDLTFYRTPGAVLVEVAVGTLVELPGNEDYRIANVSFAYAVPEVRMLVERLAQQYRSACGEQLVVTSLTRPAAKQPRNAHELSVHPAGMAVDLRISQNAACRSWLETTLLSLEGEGVLDVTRERYPPHYHVAVFPTPYREYVQRLDSKPVLIHQPETPPVKHAAVAAVPESRDQQLNFWALAVALSILPGIGLGLATLRKKRKEER